MSIALYMDVHVHRAITAGLRLASVDGIRFAGVIYGHQQKVTIGNCVRDLDLIAKVYDLDEMMNQVQFIPL
ncbi:MAG: hypothetical protein GY796_12085 [Chloroflexi bacterium]|nr:hypothetical protein [Chloroflexota bacterium]